MDFPSVKETAELDELVRSLLAANELKDLNSPETIKFLRTVLGLTQPLPEGMIGLDASHPWLVFWPMNALELLGAPLSSAEKRKCAETVLTFQNPSGGFGGGVGQPSHVIATYAAVMALSFSDKTVWSQIRVPEMQQWLLSMKLPSGAFKTCEHGEADPRTAYCALAVAQMLGICTPALSAGVGEFVQSCQTYEGGFANTPLGEAHGGYAFCSVAALMLLGPDSRAALQRHCNTRAFVRWLHRRQNPVTGGFEGRCGKLTDSCYAHWVGGCWPLVQQVTPVEDPTKLWDRLALLKYLALCCQHARGGLIDKPGARPDAYHTNYALCGVALVQHVYTLAGSVFDWNVARVPTLNETRVQPINPVFGIPFQRAQEMHAFFAAEVPSSSEYQGFALYVSATAALLIYLAWALLPRRWLHRLSIFYFPSRYWAVAVPAFLLMLMVYVYVGLDALNKEVLTPPASSEKTFTDADSAVHDARVVEVSESMYA